MTKIGVFDSGVGGDSVAKAIRVALPEHEVIYVTDRENIPYGTKTKKQLRKLVLPILNKLSKSCDVIVVACNTVSTLLIQDLRKEIRVPLIAMEPMVKPAAELSQTGTIAVCATPATLGSKRYQWLKNTYAQDIKVLEPDCSDWALLIENKQIDRSHIHEQIDSVCEKGADVVVLGCTHYHWIEDIVLEETRGRAKVIQPEKPVIEQLKRVLEQIS